MNRAEKQAVVEVAVEALGVLAEEAATLEPREKRTVVQWAADERVLDAKTAAIPGRFNWEYTPYLIEPALAISDPEVRAVILQKCAQCGGTELTNNVVGWAVDESPTPMMVIMPSERDVSRRVDTRLREMFQACPSLMRHLGGDLANLNIGKETILDNCIIYLAWASSAAALGDSPVCLVIFDEVDKYPGLVGREADPISLGEQRQRTFLFAKTFELSTPTDQWGRIHADFQAGDRREWWAKCPHCGEYHILKWANVQLDKTKDGKLLTPAEYAAGGHARYACSLCGAIWTEAERWEAVSAGRWAPAGQGVDAEGKLTGKASPNPRRSYHVSALMLYPGFVSMDALAEKWALARERYHGGDYGPLIDFINSQLGEVYTPTEATTDQTALAKHIGGYAFNTLPEGVRVLTAGVDVQMDCFYAAVWGWGAGYENWLIARRRIETTSFGEGAAGQMDFEPLREFLGQTFPIVGKTDGSEGETMPISLTFIDAQYRTDQVYEFCAGFTSGGDCYPARGEDGMRDGYMTPSKLERTTARRRRVLRRGQLELWRCSTLLLKSQLARLMNVPNAGAGYMHLPEGTDEDFLKQMTSEYLRSHRGRNRYGKMRDERLWILKPEHTANHYWDASYLALAAARHRGVHRLTETAEPPRKAGRRMSSMERFRR